MFGRKDQDTATVVSLLAGCVRRDISFGVLAPDTRLKIEDLRRKYGGSAHSLREALTQLSMEGLVEANAQRGFRVASATEADLRDITRLRAEVECLGLRWAMEHGDVAWEGEVIAAHHALSRAEDEVMRDPLENALQWDECNRLFHGKLIAACGSPRLIEFHGRLYDQSRRFRLAALRENKIDLDSSRTAHEDIVKAVVARDAERAVALLDTHIRKATDSA